MSFSRQSVLLIAAVCVFHGCLRANACPHCNIHNYLADSVRSSTNIFYGRVVRQVDGETAEVFVLSVLRGELKVGTKVETLMYGAKEYIGEKFIFSNPTSWAPTFEVLLPDYGYEVRFLAEGKPPIRSVQEAIWRVQGVSVETQAAGLKYVQ